MRKENCTVICASNYIYGTYLLVHRYYSSDIYLANINFSFSLNTYREISWLVYNPSAHARTLLPPLDRFVAWPRDESSDW